MEALAAVGLAANVVQFLELGQKLVSGSIELYRASDGATSINSICERITRDLIELCHSMESAERNCTGKFQIEAENALIPLAKVSLDVRYRQTNFIRTVKTLTGDEFDLTGCSRVESSDKASSKLWRL